MRGDYQQRDWAARDSLAEVTEIYIRPEATPIPAPLPPAPAPLPNVRMFSIDDRFAIPDVFPMGSAPRMRVSDTTHRVPRRAVPRNVMIGIGVTVCIALGIALGLATTRGGASLDDVAAKPTHVAAPVATSQMTVTPIVTPSPAPVKPAMVTVHIESLPGGATATLLDNGKPTQLGMTPLDAELDPAKSYDVVVSLDGRTPRVQHLVPAQQQDLVFAFDDDVAKPAVKPVAHVEARVEPKHADRHVDKHVEPAVEAAAMGSLKIASKPPCAIAIDGRATGKMTPQASLSLAAGTHEITFTNEEQGIQITTSVEIKADKATDLFQDFTK
jgi:hypothetical protein